MPENGREPCPGCDDRATEKTNSSKRRDSFKCHNCGHEWSEKKEVETDPYSRGFEGLR